MSRSALTSDLTQAIIGGVVATLVTFGGGYAVGSVSGFEAMRLLEASLPTTRFLASGMMTANATILALMLTLLSLSYSTEVQLRSEHYHRVKQIAFITTLGFVLVTVFLLLLIIPMGETENVPTGWYDGIYYAVLGVASTLGGMVIATVLMLYHTVRDVILTISGEGGGPLVAEE